MRKCLKEYLVKAMLLKINNVGGSEPLRKGFLWCRNYDVITANTFTRKEYEKVFQIQSGSLKVLYLLGFKVCDDTLFVKNNKIDYLRFGNFKENIDLSEKEIRTSYNNVVIHTMSKIANDWEINFFEKC